MSPLSVVALVALALVVAGWLLVSFLKPSRARLLLEWIAASAALFALFCFFARLVLEAWHGDHTVRLIAFGFLAVVFGSSFVVSAVKTAGQLGGRKAPGPSVAN